MTNHQRVGAISNAHAGREFEAAASEYFARVEGLRLSPSVSVPIGVAGKMKPHCFDLGAEQPPLLVECKSHNWTITGNMPSAKITVWNEAMYYFHLAPKHYKKILFVLAAWHHKQKKSLAEYYCDINEHLIPTDVGIFEYDPESRMGRYVKVPG